MRARSATPIQTDRNRSTQNPTSQESPCPRFGLELVGSHNIRNHLPIYFAGMLVTKGSEMVEVSQGDIAGTVVPLKNAEVHDQKADSMGDIESADGCRIAGDVCRALDRDISSQNVALRTDIAMEIDGHQRHRPMKCPCVRRSGRLSQDRIAEGAERAERLRDFLILHDDIDIRHHAGADVQSSFNKRETAFHEYRPDVPSVQSFRNL